jgi:hypothetical protein
MAYPGLSAFGRFSNIPALHFSHAIWVSKLAPEHQNLAVILLVEAAAQCLSGCGHTGLHNHTMMCLHIVTLYASIVAYGTEAFLAEARRASLA